MAKQKEKITLTEWISGFCSFIPFLGVFFGGAAIILGSIRFRIGGWKLILLGLGGIFFTIGSYFLVLHIFLERPLGKTGIYETISRQNLRQTVMALEFYRQVHGQYPEKLIDAGSQDKFGFNQDTYLYDSSGGMSMAGKLQPYQYELTADRRHYYLFGVGLDQKPNTADDVFPNLTPEEAKHIGYLKKQSP